MKQLAGIALAALLLGSCGEPAPEGPKPLFNEVPGTEGDTLVLPEGYSYQVLFKAGESIVTTASGGQGPAKENGDFIGYLPIDGSSAHGYLYVSHETKASDDVLGDGGGATVFEIQKENGQWNVIGDYKHVDFSGVGLTLRNC